MLEQVFVKLLEGTALIAVEGVSRWLTDLLFWTVTTVAGAREMLSTSTGSPAAGTKGSYCEHFPKACAILGQSIGCGCQLTECTLLHKDNQLWYRCTTMNCSEGSWSTSGHYSEEASTRSFQDCCSAARINRDMENAMKMDAKGKAGVYCSQDDCMEMLIVDQNDCSLSLSISDCTFNHSGKLVRMTVSFEEFDSGASCSSSGNKSDLDDESYESDSEEDFIIFDSNSDGKGRSTSFDSCSSANSTSVFDEFCWEEKANFENNLVAFVKGVNHCHPFYCHRQTELKYPGKELTPKGINIGNNNVPVMWSSAKEPCILGKAKELPKSSHSLNCETQDVICDSCQRKNETTEKTTKCVQFKKETELVTMHSIVAWDFAYRQARIGPWERAAVDRLRFQKRIQELEEVLAPVLLGQKLKSEQKLC